METADGYVMSIMSRIQPPSPLEVFRRWVGMKIHVDGIDPEGNICGCLYGGHEEVWNGKEWERYHER